MGILSPPLHFNYRATKKNPSHIWEEMLYEPFVYDDGHPPLCLRSCESTTGDLSHVRRAIKQHLYESGRDGLKDANAMLECGLTAGEAAVFHIRDINSKRRVVNCDPALQEWVWFVKEKMHQHFQLNFDDPLLNEIFDRHIHSSLFQTKQMSKQMSVSLKHFLSEIQLKDKGYTAQLKRVLEDVEKKWSKRHPAVDPITLIG